ncbi:hypothetical protein CPB86DRAFT_790285 [Serendipita vermifera]|nr:hypothetical protein CPB86DRAFT_790285 [Serendipita vermifera]
MATMSKLDSSDRYPLVNPDSLRVSHVCRSWRTIALAIPRLWVDIRLPLGESTSFLEEMWTVVTKRARKCPVNLDVVSTEMRSEECLFTRIYCLKAWTSSPIRIGELKITAFDKSLGPFDLVLNYVSNFSSLTYRYESRDRQSTSPITVETIIDKLSSVPSCNRLELVGLGFYGLRRGKATCNLRHLSIQDCWIDNGDNMNKLVNRCPKLESCTFRNTIRRRVPLAKLPSTLRVLEADKRSHLDVFFSSPEPIVYPHLTTCIIDRNHSRIEEFVEANPTIVTLSVPPGVDIIQIANIAPQIRCLKVRNPTHALLLCNSDASDGLGLFSHLEELRIYLYDPVSVDQFEQILRPVDKFNRPQDENSQLEKLTLSLSRKACGNDGLCIEDQMKPWCEWLEERGYLDRVFVERSKEVWRFSWSRIRFAASGSSHE